MERFNWHTVRYTYPQKNPQQQIMFDKTNLQHTDCYNFQCNVRQWRHLLSTVTVMFAVLLAGIQQGVELPESVCSIMPCGDISLCYSIWQQVSTYHQYALPTSTQRNTHNRTAIWNTINPSSCSTARFCFSVQHHVSFCSQQQQSVWCPFMSAKIQKP